MVFVSQRFFFRRVVYVAVVWVWGNLYAYYLTAGDTASREGSCKEELFYLGCGEPVAAGGSVILGQLLQFNTFVQYICFPSRCCKRVIFLLQIVLDYFVII